MPNTETNRSPEHTPELGTHERMEIVYNAHGFLPFTKDELNDIVSIDAFPTKKGGAARGLNEVLLHQKKANTDNPEQAVRSKTEEFVWYAKQAHQDCKELLELNHQFREMLNPSLTLADYLEDIAIDEQTASLAGLAGVHQLVRFLDLNEFRQTRNPFVSGLSILKKHARIRGDEGSREVKDAYSSYDIDSEVETYIEKRLAEITVGSLRKGKITVVEKAYEASHNRFDYWTDVLKASKAHTLARPIAQRALALLTEKKQVK